MAHLCWGTRAPEVSIVISIESNVNRTHAKLSCWSPLPGAAAVRPTLSTCTYRNSRPSRSSREVGASRGDSQSVLRPEDDRFRCRSSKTQLASALSTFTAQKIAGVPKRPSATLNSQFSQLSVGESAPGRIRTCAPGSGGRTKTHRRITRTSANGR